MEVSGEDNELRRRFSIAHMIGHWIMHRGLLGQGLNEGPDYVQEVLDQHYNPEIGEREETEANMFAAELLLPSGLVLPLAESGTVDLATAAQRLKCSASGLRIRMELLEYAPEDHGLEQLIP